MGRIIGIDLGTTNSCVAVLDGSAVQIIPNNLGGRTTPSVVAFTEKNQRLIGQIARRQAITNAANTVYAVKRLMGRRFDAPEIQKLRGYLGYQLAGSPNGDVRISIRGREYSPPEIAAMILLHLRNAAESCLNEEIKEAVITVPAYFDDSQRQATKDAGRIAGLEVRRIINEPTAAALAYGLGKKDRERVAIYDLGGGTFDISILELNNGVFEVLSTCGDSFLGGEDFDQVIMDWIAAEFQAENGIDLSDDVLAKQRLKEAAERAKCELSVSAETPVNLPFVAHNKQGPIHFSRSLTRAMFEQMTQALIDRTTGYCEQALKDAKLLPEQVDKVILVGGQTRTPAVQRHVEKIFAKKPSVELNPDEVVAAGAALQGGVLDGEIKEIVLLDVLPLSLGVETQGGLFARIIDRNSTIPLRRSTMFTTVADNQAVVDIHVLQGERELAKFNRSLARFELVGIPPAPRGAPQIDVTFDIDANGIVSVSAKDRFSGKEQAIRITPSTGLSNEEIDLMVLEAKQHAESDRRAREVAELRNRIVGQAAALARSYVEFGRFLEQAEQAALKDAMQQAKNLPSEDPDYSFLQELMSRLEEGAARLANAMFTTPADPMQNVEESPEGMRRTDSHLSQLSRSAMDDIGSS